MTDPGSPDAFPDVSGTPNKPLDACGWDARWTSKDTPWDLGHAAPPLARALRDGLVKSPARSRGGQGGHGRAIVMGCGAGHDAREVASHGFETTGIDLSATAVTHAKELATRERSTARFEVADFLALPPHLRGVDLLVEHTLFCAIDPALRDRYVDAAADALAPGGHLLALFWLIHTETGPPFGSTEAEIRTRFSRRFTFVHEEMAPDSHTLRAGKEFLVVLAKHDAPRTM